MIIKWEIIPYPSEKYPDRYKVNIRCDYADLKKIMDFYGKRCGLPWKSRTAEFSFSFYIYKMSPKGVEEFENKIKELQFTSDSVSQSQVTGEKEVPTSDISQVPPSVVQASEGQDNSGKSKAFHVSEKSGSFFSQGRAKLPAHAEPRASAFPPRSSKKQATSEEIKIAKEISEIIDFDVFEPEKLEAIEIKKENKEQDVQKIPHNFAKKETPAEDRTLIIGKADDMPAREFTVSPAGGGTNAALHSVASVVKKQEGIKKDLPGGEDVRDLPPEQSTISVGIIFRSGQEELSKIIEDNLLKSVAGKKLKYKIKVVFAKGFLVFSKDDIDDAIALCKEKDVSSVIVAGESKLAEVLHELLNSAGIFTEHINTTDVNKKSLYFNIATSIILSESGRNTEQT